MRSASTRSATAARPASATPARCPTRSPSAISQGDLVVCAVLSGNRNFEARIHPRGEGELPRLAAARRRLRARGRMDIDLAREPLGEDADGEDVFLRDLWPTAAEIQETIARGRPRRDVPKHLRRRVHGRRALAAPRRARRRPLRVGPRSTYVRRPPYFDGMPPRAGSRSATSPARAASSCSATR